jgi:hypothetical protein
VKDDPHQLELFPAPLAAEGRQFKLQMSIDFPGGADPELVERLESAGRRLRRGAVASKWKLKKLATLMEETAGLFDGAKS